MNTKPSINLTSIALALIVGTLPAAAGLDPSSVLTSMDVSATSAKLTGTVVVTAQIQRLDGQTYGLAGIPVKFFVSEGTYPTSNFGIRYTDGSGKVTISISGRNFSRVGKYIVVAEANPSPCPENWVAKPTPFARFSITK